MKIQVRRGTESAWTSADPILAAGEIGYETDTGRAKVGDGIQAWTELAYRFETGGAPPDGTVTTAKLGGDVTAAGKALLTDSDSDAQRATLGLGSLATVTPTGTPTGSKFLRDDGSWQAASGGASLNSTAVAFTDGDTVRRVTVTDAEVAATDKILVAIRRPDLADDSADAGHIYLANVVLVGTGSFDVVVACCDRGFCDTTEQPPSETVQLVWMRAA